MGGLGLGLVAIGGMALASGGLVFNSGSDKASFLDVADARTVSSGELFVSLSSGFLFVASLVGGSLVFGVSGNDGDCFWKQRPRICRWRRRQSLPLSMAVSDGVIFGGSRGNGNNCLAGGVLDGGGCFGNNNIARGSGCITAVVHGI